MPRPVLFRVRPGHLPSRAFGLFALSVVLLAGGRLARAVPGDGGKPAPEAPSVQPASDEGAQALAGFTLPEAIRGRLAAAEPNVANVVAFDFDGKGRIYVCETFRQSRGVEDNRKHAAWLMDDLAAQTVEDRRAYILEHIEDAAKSYTRYDDRIRLLTDEDGDHVVDRATVFAEGFNDIVDGTGAGVLAVGPDVYYACIPSLYRLRDADGDGVADDRAVMSTGYGVRFAFRGHDMHGLIQGPDGRLYWSIGDRGYNVAAGEGQNLIDPASGAVFRCNPDGSGLEVVHTGLRNPQELAFDDEGRLFTGDNNSDSGDKARIVQIIPGADSGWRMYYQYLSDRGPFNREKIWYPYDPATQPEQPAAYVPPIANFADGPSGFCFDPGTGLNEHFRGRFFLCDFRGTPGNSGVRTFRLTEQGAGFKLVDDEQSFWNILATDCAFGPDGGFYISDWVDGWEGEGKGRLYRFTATENDPVAAEIAGLLAGGLETESSDRLVGRLSHPDRRVRQAASFDLALRGDVERLATVALDEDADVAPRLHGLWGLEIAAAGRKTRLDRDVSWPAAAPGRLAEVLTRLAEDDEPAVRRVALTMLGEHAIRGGDRLVAAAMADEDASVAAAACLAASRLGFDGQAEQALAVLDRNADADPVLRHAAVMAVTNSGATDADLIGRGRSASLAVRRGVVLALRRRGAPSVAAFLTDADPWVRTEAARAINDAPIPAAMPALAGLTLAGGEPDPLLRRWLNANFRLGTPEAAARLVSVAGEAGFSDAIREEALAMLATWAEPGPLDRVVNDYRPLDPRAADVARQAMLAGLANVFAGSEAVQSAATKTATTLGIKEVIPVLKTSLADTAQPAALRASALTALDSLDAPGVVDLARSAVAGDEPRLRAAARSILASRLGNDALGLLKEGVGSEDLAERQSAIADLARIETAPAAKLWTDLAAKAEAGDLPPETWLELAAAGDALGDRVKDARKGLADFFASQPGGKYAVSRAGGDADRGREIFFGRTDLSCVRCHKADGQGGEVGPDLSGIGAKKDRLYLLESVADPNKAIAEGFQSVLVQTDDGKTLTGVLRGETDETLTLVTAEGTVLTIDQETIEGQKQTKSAMPEDLIKLMSPSDLRDVVEYLATQKAATPGSR